MAATKVFDYEIKFDTPKLSKNLNNKFGTGSPIQAQWDNIVFNGTRRYVPRREGTMLDASYNATVFGSGELKYVGPQARRLYYNPQFTFTQSESPGVRGGRWAERASNDLKSTWAAELQKFIDRGK